MTPHSIVLRVLGVLALLVSLSAWSQPYEYHVYIDSDLRATTGCTISGGGQTFAGADFRLTATVSGNPPRVTARKLTPCLAGNFGAGNVLGANYPVGLNNGLPLAGGSFADVIELSVMRAQLPGVEPQLRIGFAAISASGSLDVLYTTTGVVGAPPMVVGSPAVIPTLGFFGALLLALGLAALALRTLKHNRRLAQMLLVGAFFSAGFAAWAANFIADGQVGDWAGSSPIGMDAIGDSVPNLAATDIVGAFAADENRSLYFRIDVVDAENRPPVAVGDAYTTLEDGVLTIAAPGVLANDSDPDGNPISAQLVSGPTRGTLQLNADGSFTYTPNANANGSDAFTYNAFDGQVTSLTPATVTIAITPVNDVPVFAVGSPQTVLEDAGPQSVNPWATGIDDGDPEVTQNLTFEITANSNAALFSAGPAVSPTGVLSYTPAANANGSATITLRLNDDGSGAPPNVNQSATQTFTITVTAVNDAPTLTAVNPPAVLEDAGPQTVAGWAVFNPGPADEAGQTVLGYQISAISNAALFAVPPAVANDGTLTYTAAANANGSSTFVARVQDSGGTANGGVDLSIVQTFTITVTGINDVPSFTVGPNQTVDEDAGAQTVSPWATSINDGDPEVTQVLAFTITANTNAALFSAGPAVSPTGALSYTPAANANGSATITLRLQDDGSNTPPNVNTSATQTFTITVNAINDAPSFAAGPNLTVNEDAAAQSINPWATAISPGPADESGQTVAFAVTNNSNAALFSVLPSISATGVLTYTPAANAFGVASITLTLADNGPGAPPPNANTSAPQTFTITVSAVDDAPVAVNDNATVAEDAGATAVPVLANDTDIDAGPINITSVTQPANGAVVITGGGAGLTYAPNLNYCNAPPGTTPDTFTYTLSPGGSSATVSMAVTCVDDAPVAVNDTATVVQGSGPNAIAVLANDTDVDGGPISIGAVTQPTNGTVVITGGGTGVTYAPNAGYCNDTPPGTPTSNFTYTLTPGGSTATVGVTVICDVPPVAVADAATVVEDSGANAVDVLANDTDVDGGPRAVAAVTQPANGVVVITGGGTGLTYQPNPNYCNAPPGAALDTFSYTLTPGSSSTTVTMTVTCVDDNPVAVADSATVAEDSGANAIPVLANDTDIDAGPISIGSVTQPANGTVVITGGGTGVTYAPNANYCNNPPGGAPDTFTYTLNGGSSATVAVTVTCVDDAPVAVNDNATVAEDSGANPIAVLANDTDIDAGPRSITSVTQPANGTVVITGGGSGLSYTPNANFCDIAPPGPPDTFTYTLTPGGSSATVSVTVTCVDDAPVAVNDSATVGQNTAANPIPVLANDTDIDAGPIGIGSVTQPADGTVVITGGGSGLSYTPTAGYCNNPPGTTPSTFTYTLAPGGSTATVSVLVNCDTPPTAVDDSATVIEDAPAAAVPVLANDTDPDGGPISITAVTQPLNGTVIITGGGTGVTYQPIPNYCNAPPGTTLDTFSYTLSPGGSTATVSMTVTCVDDLPIAVADAATVVEDSGPTAMAVLANDTDIDGGPKTVNAVTQPANGTVVITGGGTGLTYAPNADYCNNPPGTTLSTFTYTLNGGSSTTVTVTVTCVDDNPAALNDTATVVEDSSATAIPVLANDTDPDGGAISITAVTQPANGVVVITGGGTGVTYQPNANYCNAPPGTTPDMFTYTLTPGGSTATVSVAVTCVDDPPVAANDAATVLEDAAATAVTVLVNDTDPDAGPISITAVTQPVNGTVVITGGGTGLTFAPNANYCNNPPGTTLDTFTYTLTPGGSSATVTMTVTCVNDPPVFAVNPIGYIAAGNTQLHVAGATRPGVVNTSDALGALAKSSPTDVDGPAAPAAVAASGASVNGGNFQVFANGSFTYVPPAGFTGVDSFVVQVSDSVDNAALTVNVTISQIVWYVRDIVDANNPAGGDGRSSNAFETLTAVAPAAGLGHTIFVFAGNTAATPLSGPTFSLRNGQKLHGEGVGLTLPTHGTLIPAGTLPRITNPAGSTLGVVTSPGNDLIGIEIRGLSISASGTAIRGLSNGTQNLGLLISDSVIEGAGQRGIAIDHPSTGTATVALRDLTLTSTQAALDVNRAAGAGPLTITAFEDISVTGNSLGFGILVGGDPAAPVVFDATPGGAYNQVLGGVSSIGQSGNGTGNAGVFFNNVSGDLAYTDLDVYSDTGDALSITGTGVVNVGAGTGLRVTIPAGAATLSASAGGGLVLSTMTADMQLAGLASTNGSSGVRLTGVGSGSSASTISAPAGSTISNSSLADFSISGGNATVSYGGTISDATGVAVSVSGATGGTKTFSGAISSGSVNLANNTGATINFSGGVILSTATSAAFSATGGGTVNVTGTNTLATTTGTALTVVDTTIGASNVNFRSISANGGTNGIVLNNTGTSGGLVVTGTGSAGSGGTIQNTTTRGASFIDTSNISLSWMNFTNAATADFPAAPTGLSLGVNTADNAAIHLQDATNVTLDRLIMNGSAEHGINGHTVRNFTLSNSTLTNLGNGADEDGLHFYNMVGTCSISSTNIASSGDDNINIQNNNNLPADLPPITTTTLTITGGSANTGVLGSGYLFGIRGTMNTTLVISGVTANNNFSGGIVADTYDTATSSVEISGVTSTNNNDGISLSSSNGNTRFDIHDNVSFTGNDFGRINILKAAFSTTGTLQGFIRNNPSIVVGDGQTTDAIGVFQAGDGVLTVAITGNDIDYRGTQRAILLQGGQDGSGQLNATIRGNSIDMQLDGTGNAAAGILAQVAVASPSGDNTNMCADIGGAGALANVFTHTLGGNMPAGDIRMRQRFVTTVSLPGYLGAANAPASVVTYLAGRNTLVNAPTATVTTDAIGGGGNDIAGAGGYVSVGNCTQPVFP